MSDERIRMSRAAKCNLRRMPAWQGGVLSCALLAALGCGGGRHHAGGLDNEGPLDLNHNLQDAGTEPPANTEDVDAGATVPVPDPADAATPPPDAGPRLCGDGTIDPGEECDPGLPASESCEQRGFAAGLLGCSLDCHFSTESCSGVEDCSNGRDDDGDSLSDCADSDCSSACADACQSPVMLAENVSISGTTQGHPASLAASCSDAAPSGSEIVYQVTASEDCKLDVVLTSDHALNASVRSICLDGSSEMACGGQTRLTVDALAGQTYFIVVDGASSAEAGAYLLELHTRQEACGDGVRDADEECDDGDTNGGDGCDSACLVELSETEANDRRFQANTFDFTPWFAQISPADDVDYYRVALTADSSTLVVDTLDLGDGACASNGMDTLVDILDTNTNGNALLSSDDNEGEGKCSHTFATGLPPGTYFVRVQAAAAASPATFPYRLEMWVGVCGDSDPTLGEGCDDGNQNSGDGCDANCQVEVGP